MNLYVQVVKFNSILPVRVHIVRLELSPANDVTRTASAEHRCHARTFGDHQDGLPSFPIAYKIHATNWAQMTPLRNNFPGSKNFRALYGADLFLSGKRILRLHRAWLEKSLYDAFLQLDELIRKYHIVYMKYNFRDHHLARLIRICKSRFW